MINRITSIIILLSIILLAFSAIYGIKIGRFQILSVSQLQEKNAQLNQKIDEANNLTSIDYPKTKEDLEETYEKYKIQRQKYEELSGFVDEDNEEIYETKQYDIGYLWKIFGKYATSRNLGIGMDVQRNSNKPNSYNLNFSVSGEYINISQFITDIENNSDLYFRIYNFQMSGSGAQVVSTFTVKDINIDPSTLSNTGSSLETDI